MNSVSTTTSSRRRSPPLWPRPRKPAGLDALYEETSKSFETGNILTGVVLRREGDDVLLDVGCKSEGMVPFNEWEPEDEPPHPGQKIEVLLEEFDDALGVILLSRRKAKRIRDWEKIISTHKEGDIVKGLVQRKIKGGLLVDIGVNVFLPASQVDIRRPADIGDYIGKTVECVILKIDEARRNIVVSRRKLIEDQREKLKKSLLAELKVGRVAQGGRQEHRRLRRVRRPGGHRRPAAHYRHELRPHQPSRRRSSRSTTKSKS